jgi:hypothetical protein
MISHSYLKLLSIEKLAVEFPPAVTSSTPNVFVGVNDDTPLDAPSPVRAVEAPAALLSNGLLLWSTRMTILQELLIDVLDANKFHLVNI